MQPIRSDNEENPLVSVIVPTYNRSGFIEKTVDSVWAQTYRPIELIVVDDGSTDNTKPTVAQWAKVHAGDKSFTVRYFFLKNAGAPSARNHGLKNARGRYLQFLDSDDRLVPAKLAHQQKALQSKNAALCICDYMDIDEDGAILRVKDRNIAPNTIIRRFFAVTTAGTLIDRSFFKEEMLLWNERIRKLQDKDYFVKLLMVSHKVAYVPENLFKWTHHSGERISDDRTPMREVKWAILKSLLGYHGRYFWRVPAKRTIPLLTLYAKLFYSAMGLGALIPRPLKFWKWFSRQKIRHTFDV